MVRPLIGVSAGHLLGEGSRQRRQAVFVGCGERHVAEVVRAGGVPLLVPPVGDRDTVRAILDTVDGLLLTGGGDVRALEFGAQPHPAARLVDPQRDRTEIEACRLAARRAMPILAICRGIQVLNVALGGDLVQDIPTEIKGAIGHWNPDLSPSLGHTIDIEPGSLLAALLGSGKVPVSSYHHQAVGRVAKGLRVTARAADGVIEALEAKDRWPILAVQFHPEEVAGEHTRFRALFDWLIREARRYRRVRR